MTKIDFTLFYLIRLALGGCEEEGISNYISLSPHEWKELVKMAYKQRVPALTAEVVKCIDSFPSSDLTEWEEVKYEWLGSVFHSENENKIYFKSLLALCKKLSAVGLTPMLLKGYGLAQNYPNPLLRPTGDIDIWVEGRALETDKFVAQIIKRKVKKSNISHHSHFMYEGFSVENHYELSSTYYGDTRSKCLEMHLQQLAKEGFVRAKNLPFVYPTPNFNALFLLWHMGEHFCSEDMVLRHICDWIMFLKRYHGEVDWPRIILIWEETHLNAWAEAICGIMVKYFAMPREWMPVKSCDDKLVERIMMDILTPECRLGTKVENIVSYRKKAWKYRLVYNQHWLVKMFYVARLRLFHNDDYIERELNFFDN